MDDGSKENGFFGKLWSRGSGFVSGSLDRMGQFFQGGDSESKPLVIKAVVASIHRLIHTRGNPNAKTLNAINRALHAHRVETDINAVMDVLRNPVAPDISNAERKRLELLNETQRTAMVTLLCALVELCDVPQSDKEAEAVRFAASVNLPESAARRCMDEVEALRRAKKNYVVSVTGIASALFIIVIFILTATYLRSVFFGLLLAFFLIPLQLFFNRLIFNRGPYRAFLRGTSRIIGALRRPFFRKSVTTPDAFEAEVVMARRSASHSAFFTFIVVLLAGLTVSVLLLVYSIGYVNDTGRDIRSFANTIVTEEHGRKSDSMVVVDSDLMPVMLSIVDTDILVSPQYFSDLLAGLVHRIDHFADGFESYPEIQKGIRSFADGLHNPENRRRIAVAVAEEVRGILPAVLSFFGSSVRIAIDILLTLVFCVLFMQIFARVMADASLRAKSDDGRDIYYRKVFGKLTPGGYIVYTLFASSWLPAFSADAGIEAATILNGVFDRVQAWLRGYLGIILIEAPIYVIVLSLIGVPYSVPLGLISACGLLIPIFLPTTIVVTAFLLTLSMPDVRLLDLLLVGLTYASVMGVLEWTLYPQVGKKLGLSLLETLCAVLLGGYLFGLVGLLLAIPTMGVLKYLTPLVWQCWFPKPEQRDDIAVDS